VPPDLPAVGGQVSLFRFPRGGGPVQVYQADSLTPSPWRSLQPVPPLRRLLGADVDERLLWALDTGGNLISVDLETRGIRKAATDVAAATLSPDGSLYLVDSSRKVLRLVRRQPVRFHDPLPANPRALYGAINEQLIAITGGSAARLITANADQDFHSTPLPPGEATVTTWGDLVAVAADTAVVLYETGGQRGRSSITSVDHARRVGFSPSGHRIYVTQDNSEIRVYDRFSLKQLQTIVLPGLPREFRVDHSGRWLLTHPATGDSLWIVDLATNALTGTVPGNWSTDLPLVAGAATLLVRLRDVLTSYDLRQSPPTVIAKLPGGGADLWLAAAWVPPDRLSAAVAAAESASVTQDSALRADSTVTPSDSAAIYLQVSRTQNPDWADLLTRQLKSDGYPALILAPKEAEEGYRVVIGPYATRETAESTGKQLGRAYFILRLPAKTP
jgi:sporulation related protein